MSKINVNLYGGKSFFGGKESPLEADEIYCDVADTCSFYKEGKCLRCRTFLSPTCKFGSNNVVKGYTSRAQKYYAFKSKYTADPVYHKLSYPRGKVAVMNDHLYMDLTYTAVYKSKEEVNKWNCKIVDGYVITDKGFSICDVFIPLNEVTNTLLYGIFSYKPQAMMGGTIKEYQDKIVPDILQDLKKVAPEIYNKFIAQYPEYNKAPNYIGKYAYIDSMVEESKLKSNNGVFTLRDGKLCCENYSSSLLPFDARNCSMTIPVTADMIYKVDDNSQCNENTRFE